MKGDKFTDAIKVEVTANVPGGPGRWKTGSVEALFPNNGGLAVVVDDDEGRLWTVPFRYLRVLTTHSPQAVAVKLVRDINAEEVVMSMFYRNIYEKMKKGGERETFEEFVRRIKSEESEAMLVSYKGDIVGGLVADRLFDEALSEEIFYVGSVAVAAPYVAMGVRDRLMELYMRHYDGMRPFVIETDESDGEGWRCVLPPVNKGGDYRTATVKMVSSNPAFQKKDFLLRAMPAFLRELYRSRRMYTERPECDDSHLLWQLDGKRCEGLEFILCRAATWTGADGKQKRFGRKGDRVRIGKSNAFGLLRLEKVKTGEGVFVSKETILNSI